MHASDILTILLFSCSWSLPRSASEQGDFCRFFCQCRCPPVIKARGAEHGRIVQRYPAVELRTESMFQDVRMREWVYAIRRCMGSRPNPTGFAIWYGVSLMMKASITRSIGECTCSLGYGWLCATAW